MGRVPWLDLLWRKMREKLLQMCGVEMLLSCSGELVTGDVKLL